MMLPVSDISKKITVVTVFFAVVSLLDMVGVILNMDELRYIFKPMLMLSLVALYLVTTTYRNNWYIGALLFSFLGDVLLLFDGEIYFILGLLSFLIAHIIYIVIVLSWITTTSIKKIVVASLPFLIYFLFLINFLRSSLNQLFMPVVIYGLTISTMGLVSLLYYLNSKNTAAKYMITGACLFVISDSVLAINKFYTSISIFPIVVMFTYLTAQYLILKAILTYEKYN
ncbi:lysoplasmalogenase [Aureibaculum marinum]|uniref:Lysoplasmalogenase n=1 Tax=Aureibaculum marinum TaxID=2487930 RepID=A0A3N4NUP8_9FLAO|nr:lysoplasmalogenase [Aureibaculum marinum]RPE00093.1 lysoplasmalogenase [Aureibaculum marinum]